MDTFTAIKARRAVKHYDPDFAMPAEHEAKLMELSASPRHRLICKIGAL